jgi:hypothetical protein
LVGEFNYPFDQLAKPCTLHHLSQLGNAWIPMQLDRHRLRKITRQRLALADDPFRVGGSTNLSPHSQDPVGLPEIPMAILNMVYHVHGEYQIEEISGVI